MLHVTFNASIVYCIVCSRRGTHKHLLSIKYCAKILPLCCLFRGSNSEIRRNFSRISVSSWGREGTDCLNKLGVAALCRLVRISPGY